MEKPTHVFPGHFVLMMIYIAINWLRFDLGEDNVSHLEPEELKYHRALARQ